jgi:hypothetical protein
MGSGPSMSRPPRHPVPEGKTRICVAGYKISPFTGRSRTLAGDIAKLHPDQYESWFYFDAADAFYAFLKETFDPVPFPPHLKGHASSPFVWLEKGASNAITPIGGNDYFVKWILANPDFAKSTTITDLAKSWVGPGDMFHNSRQDAPQATADIS